MNEELRKWITNASYKQLLERNRFGSLSDPIFEGESGKLFMDCMFKQSNKLSTDEQVKISKEIGWDK